MTPRAWSAALVIAVMAIAPLAHAGYLDQTAGCPEGVHIVVQWSWYETPGSPVDYPQWVGYDVLRRIAGTCDSYVRLNDQSFPRIVGQSHSGSYTEVAPAMHTTFEYRVVPVDASHQPVIMSSVDCEPPCIHYASASCPDLSGPTAIGTVSQNLGWTVTITPCGGTCWYSFYVTGQSAIDALVPYAGTGQVFAFYGGFGCGGIEGCGLAVTRFDPADCGPTPAQSSSWGRLKTLYR
jgi:hypothetical protein